MRSMAGTLTAAYGLLFLVPQLAKALPSQWYRGPGAMVAGRRSHKRDH
jgi:hypothetical protein